MNIIEKKVAFKLFRIQKYSPLIVYCHILYRPESFIYGAACALALQWHIKTIEKRAIIQQYGDWYTGR